MNNKRTTFNRLDYTYKILMVIALIMVGTILARDIVIPMMIAGILTVVLMPIVKKLEQKISSTLAITIVLLSTLILFVLVGILIINQLASLVNDLTDQ